MLLNFTYTDSVIRDYYATPLPNLLERQHAGDAAFDLRTTRDLEILGGHIAAGFTGIRVAIPRGHVGLVTPRSGLAKTGLTIPNSPGVIDSGYRGEIILLLRNDSKRPMYFDSGDRIAQLLVMPLALATPNYQLPSRFDQDSTDRGTGGFGSTGRK